MIPKDKIEELKARASIVDVVAEYVQLSRRGANHLGLCPFHSEKTPSFSVNEEKKIYYCFGCNETGNAITFVMQMDGLSFPEAVRSLAARYGVDIAEERSAVTGFKEALFKANTVAADFFVRELHTPAARPVREYLKKRGYTDAGFLKSFMVGYAPEGWEGLVGELKRKGVPMDVAEKAGLVVKKTRGHYDRFRGRLIFPITDIRGRVVGFGGRTLADVEPKYLNSPETPVFKKGTVLFGLHQAKKAMGEKGFAIVVEGYFDLLALHKSGFANTVATMGTAVTESHIRSLKGYAKSVYALFDTDTAGTNAALRSLSLFLAEGMPCRAVRLPEGKDPDEFILAKGPGAMEEAVLAAEPLMEFYLKELARRFDLKTPEGKSEYFKEAVSRVKMVDNVAERGHYAATLASVLNIPLDSVFGSLGMTGGRAAGPGAAKRPPSGGSLMELTILKVLVKHPELLSERVEAALSTFTDPALVDAAGTITECIRGGFDGKLTEIVPEIKDERLKSWMAAEILDKGDGFVEDPEKMLEDCLKKVLNRGKLKITTEEMIRRLEESGRGEDAVKVRKRAEKPRYKRG